MLEILPGDMYVSHSHLLCCFQDLGLGEYCCPRQNGTSQCCDTNPNPPSPEPVSGAPDWRAASVVVTAVVVAVAAAAI